MKGTDRIDKNSKQAYRILDYCSDIIPSLYYAFTQLFLVFAVIPLLFFNTFLLSKLMTTDQSWYCQDWKLQAISNK